MDTPLEDNLSSRAQGLELLLLFGLNFSMNESKSVKSECSSARRHAHCAGFSANAIAALAFFATGKSREMLSSCWNDYEHVRVERQEKESVWNNRVLQNDQQAIDLTVLNLDDEDERDERGKGLLGEARDVAHESAQIEGHDEDQQESHPEADPEAEAHEVYLERPARGQGTRVGPHMQYSHRRSKITVLCIETADGVLLSNIIDNFTNWILK